MDPLREQHRQDRGDAPGRRAARPRSMPSFRARVAATWSEPIVSTSPAASPCHSASASASSRIGGSTLARFPAGESAVSVR